MDNKIFDNILSSTNVGENNKEYLLSPRSINDFFTTGKHFIKIPDYQRPYSWKKKHVLDLLNDILKVSNSESQNSWFLGPIFTVRLSNEAKTCDLLDGQQRITTLQIILRECSFYELLSTGLDFNSMKDEAELFKDLMDGCLECLIKKVNVTEKNVRFQTESTLRELFKEYVLGFNKLKNLSELRKKQSLFEAEVAKVRNDGSITAATFLESIGHVREFIKKEFLENENSPLENLTNFNRFVHALLNCCWLIDIPLQKHNDSTQIFESLNNRGKQLTLVDKLRYKSIIKTTGSDNVHKVKNKWKTIYHGLLLLVDLKFFKSEDDFFKVFFNSLKGDGFTKVDDFVSFFESEYLKDNESILKFFKEANKILEFYKWISKSIDSDNKLIESINTRSVKIKVRSLLQMLKQTIKISSNSRFLLFSLLRNYDSDENLFDGIWNIVRIVFVNELYKDKKSNVIRSEYMKKINNSYSNNLDVTFKIEPNTQFNKSLSGIIKTDNNDEAKYILMLYTFLHEPDKLVNFSPDQYQDCQLDHLFPRAWKNHWENQKFVKEDVIEYLDSLKTSSPNMFKKISFDSLRNLIQDSEFFELQDYTTSTRTYDENLIEYIGNKWVLHAGSNASSGNYSFKQKKEIYSRGDLIKIPSNESKVGMNHYNSFTYKKIITRSIQIVDGIIVKFDSNWNE